MTEPEIHYFHTILTFCGGELRKMHLGYEIALLNQATVEDTINY